MTPAGASLVCSGCGTQVPVERGLAFACPSAVAGDDVDHVLRRELSLTGLRWPSTGEDNPFLRYRTLLYSWHLARHGGLTDEDYVGLVRRLDTAIASVDGQGLRVTPFAPRDGLARRLGLEPGQVWVKVEAGNVAGSHKVRHLTGLMISLLVAQRVAESGRPVRGAKGDAASRLAIASCGNAALAAAVVARAAGMPLDVFVPTWAGPAVVAGLHVLGASIVACERQPGVPGDPCYHRFHDAVRGGAVPFCCQGPDNGLTIEGGATLAWEMADALEGRPLDRLFVQVGGGALASACAQGLAEAHRLGHLSRVPRLHAVQTRGGHPLVRAFQGVLDRVLRALDRPPAPASDDWPLVADEVAAHPEVVSRELRAAARHRSQFMWPWETEPRSIATGILDDETYDWLAVVEGMLISGGWPVVVEEPTLEQAHRLARESTGVAVCHTGVAGLAGLLTLCTGGQPMAGETMAVVFSGAQR